MQVVISENEFSYVKDILADTGEIIVTYTANIKGNWSITLCEMSKAMLNENLEFCRNEYNSFLAEAKLKAETNGLIVF